MVKLTERLVLARSRASDLENVRKLNCWASDLTDISIIRKMQNVQIVSLSVNHITSLEDFAESMNLEELYIRKNDIANLAEIFYLRKLPRLRVLWLADNPCAVGDRYRMTVLKTLPNLQRLDNIPVQEDEVNEAIEQGLDLAPLASTLKSTTKSSTQSTPEASPAQPRKTKKVKEVKEVKGSENTEEKDEQEDTDKEVEKEKEKEKEKVLELEGGGVEKQTKDTKEVEVEESIEEDIEEQIEAEEEEVEETTKEVEKDERLETETPTTEGSKESEGESGDGGEKSSERKESSSSSGQDEESDEIEEGEIPQESSINEINDLRVNLGLKPLSADKVAQPTHSRPTGSTKARNANLLQAVLHIVKELDADSLQVVADVVSSRLETF